MLSIQSVAQHVSPPLHLHTTYHLLTVSGAASHRPHAHCSHTYQDHIIYSVTLHMMTRCRHNNNNNTVMAGVGVVFVAVSVSPPSVAQWAQRPSAGHAAYLNTG